MALVLKMLIRARMMKESRCFIWRSVLVFVVCALVVVVSAHNFVILAQRYRNLFVFVLKFT